MRKFNAVLKEKQTKEEQLVEKKVLGQFKRVYDVLLEKYGTPEFKQLPEKAQGVFLSELNSYWSESEGISEMGVKFLSTRGRALNEHSSKEQKKNFLQEKADVVISETIRQTELKYKLYNVIDEMYNEVKASNLSEVLPPDVIFETLKESFVKNIKGLLNEINYELKGSDINEEEKAVGHLKDEEVKAAGLGVIKSKSGGLSYKYDGGKYIIVETTYSKLKPGMRIVFSGEGGKDVIPEKGKPLSFGVYENEKYLGNYKLTEITELYLKSK